MNNLGKEGRQASIKSILEQPNAEEIAVFINRQLSRINSERFPDDDEYDRLVSRELAIDSVIGYIEDAQQAGEKVSIRGHLPTFQEMLAEQKVLVRSTSKGKIVKEIELA